MYIVSNYLQTFYFLDYETIENNYYICNYNSITKLTK